MRISVVGTGYVGLVSGVCLAEKGHTVICVDNSLEKVEKINLGVSPIYEEGLDTLLKKNIGTGLTATTDLEGAIASTDLTLIAVGTPFDGDEIDLQYIRQVAEEIGRALKNKSGYHVVVVKSTVVPGTTDDVVLPILEKFSGLKAGRDFGVGMNPEFLREGSAIKDFMNPDRIVLGGIDERSRKTLCRVYDLFPNIDTLMVNNKTAEMIKYTSNALLATLISFSNEIGNLCARLGDIDALDVMRGVHLDKRVSPFLEDGQRITPGITTYLEAGCGFGGSCFPKDVKALIAHGEKTGQCMDLLKTVITVNKKQPDRILQYLNKHFPDLQDVRVAVLGLAFKPGTDDMRESPAIPIVQSLIAAGADVTAYDPVAQEEAKKIFGNSSINYHESIEDTVKNTQAILLLTRWDEFKKLPEVLEKLQLAPVIVDGRRMLPRNCVACYEGIGL
ncbi:UDP-glucose dehydrogenase family protein [Desulfocastanea catecholica]